MTNKINDGGAAFPRPIGHVPPTRFNEGMYNDIQDGMTLRDYFAGRSLQGMLAHSTRYEPRPVDSDKHWHAAISKEAYEIADAMLKAREEQP